MAVSHNESPDDHLLARYLLGLLPEKEAEHVDELSVSDEGTANRLDTVENDLMDAYVRKALSQEDTIQFEKYYLSSRRRRQKVQFAESLLALERKSVSAPAKASPGVIPLRAAKGEAFGAVPGRPFSLSRLAFRWGFAAALLVILVAGGYLLLQNLKLKQQILDERLARAAAERHAQEMEGALNQQKAALDKAKAKVEAEAVKQSDKAREPKAGLGRLQTVSVLLRPAMRGASSLPTLRLHPETDLAVLVLALESGDFPAYRASLKDSTANRVLWSSARLIASPGDTQNTISISFPAALLQQRNYIVELAGIPSHGPTEVIAGYPFRAVLH